MKFERRLAVSREEREIRTVGLGIRKREVRAVQTHCESHGFGVVRAFVGHGIGRALHEEPQVPNFGDAGRGPALKAGMVLAIEPMVTMGSWEVQVLEDGWTAVTTDGSMAAHFEDTIAITEDGPEVITRAAA